MWQINRESVVRAFPCLRALGNEEASLHSLQRARDEVPYSQYGGSLVQAALDGDETILNLLLTYGADVNREDYVHAGDFPLLAAARGVHLTLVRLLLDFGADPNKLQNWVSSAAWCLPLRKEKVDMIQQLLTYKAGRL